MAVLLLLVVVVVVLLLVVVVVVRAGGYCSSAGACWGLPWRGVGGEGAMHCRC